MRLRCTVEYDGTDFAGWQRQPSARTVQGALEEAIGTVTGQSVSVVGAGRTDAGVHAAGQVAHFDTEWDRSAATLGRALNAVLPPDCAIRDLGVAPSGFHARHSATSRAYAYTLWVRRIRAPLLRRAALHVPEEIDTRLMSEAGRLLVGEHDFGAFGRPMSLGGSTVRRLSRLQVRQAGHRVIVEMEANAFLRHQVRRTVGLLIDIGRGQFGVEAASQVLARLPDAPVPRRVAPCGLVLVAVRFDGWRQTDDEAGGAAAGPMTRDRNTE